MLYSATQREPVGAAMGPQRKDEQRYYAGITPLTIGVTGHRDLVDREVPQIRERVKGLFMLLQQRFPDRPLRLLSPLAEGADQLAAEVAFELGLHVTAVLPMPVELYVNDFECGASRERFERLCAQAREVIELPILAGLGGEQLTAAGQHRNRQYAQLGVYLCAHSHILLALWDGNPSDEVGGTAQVVQFHHYDVMTGYTSADEVNQQILADDETDLVYQIVVSRRRENGKPRHDLMPLDAFWLTTDDAHPRTADLPERYVAIFERTSAFNRDARTHAKRILTEAFSLIDERSAARLPMSALAINRFFRAADWLASHYQARFLRALKYLHALVFLMAIMLVFYEDVASSQLLIVLFGLCLAHAYIMHTVATRARWHARYLEYRTLAEGLRVQFYWAVAGVTSVSITKYAHDNFLQKQDIELAWIRSVMRVAGIDCDAAPNRDPDGLAFALEQWIGDESQGGQLRYYRSKTDQYLARSSRLDRLGKVAACLVFVLLAGAVVAPSDLLRTGLFVALGTVLLIFGIRDAYAFRVAEKEVVKQYQFMHRIFHNAQKRLANAATDAERRRVLRVLGEAALDEHAEWILLHRERDLPKSQLWRMEG